MSLGGILKRQIKLLCSDAEAGETAVDFEVSKSVGHLFRLLSLSLLSKTFETIISSHFHWNLLERSARPISELNRLRLDIGFCIVPVV